MSIVLILDKGETKMLRLYHSTTLKEFVMTNKPELFIVGLAIVLLFLLSGCVSYSTVLRNPDTGKTYFCTNKGFGLIGAPVAASWQSDCEARAKQAGYTENSAHAIQ
jgi:hypothetical protein